MGTAQKYASVKFHFADGNSMTERTASMMVVDAPSDGWVVTTKDKHYFVNARHVVLVVAEPERGPV